MKKIAILLSGRVIKVNSFIELLKKEKNNYDIDVFISANDIYFDYYDKLQKSLGIHLKGFNCSEYNVPDGFKNVWYNYVDGMHNNMLIGYEKTTAAYRTLSCVYNDKQCFYMAKQYSETNNFEYDIYLRFRSDIICDSFPNFDIDGINNNILFSVIPVNYFPLTITDNPNGQIINGGYHYYGDMKHNRKYVTNDIAYGNKKTMEIYCSCYDYVMNKNEFHKGNYFICFEYTITTYLEDIGVNWHFFNYKYNYISDRHNGYDEITNYV
jgi:hypothetical protein